MHTIHHVFAQSISFDRIFKKLGIFYNLKKMYIDSNSFINIMLQLNSNQDINENESGRCNQSHTLFVGARQQQMVPTISEMQH